MKRLAILLSTAFGIGYAPGAPGTVASAAALPLGYVVLVYFGTASLAIVAVALSVIGIWASGAHANAIGRTDPGTSVIDEVVGQLLAMLPIIPVMGTGDIAPIAASFCLFRFFDIVKPWPISRLERFHGGIGIMADDIAAGLVSAAILVAFREFGVL